MAMVLWTKVGPAAQAVPAQPAGYSNSKALGIAIPKSLLGRADEVVQ